MIKPKELLDRLGGLSTFDFKGEVFRAIPCRPIRLPGTIAHLRVATLYSGCVREGALAELAFQRELTMCRFV
jgi:hypothetical protein